MRICTGFRLNIMCEGKAIMRKIKNIFRLYCKMGQIDQGFIWNLALMILLNSLHPLNGFYFLYYIIDSLETGLDIRGTFTGLCLMGAIEFAFYLIARKLKITDREKTMKIKNKLMLELQEKTISLSYQNLENPETTLAQKKALEIFYPTQAEYMDFQNVLGCVQALSFSVLQLLVLSVLLFQIHWTLIIPLLVFSVVSLWLYTVAGDKKFQVWDKELVSIGRKLSYFQEMATNFSYAKEIRLYTMGDWIVAKMKALTSTYLRGIRKSVLNFSMVGILSNLLLGLGTGLSFLQLGRLTWMGAIQTANFVSCVNVVRTFEASLLRAVENYMTIGQAMSYLQAYWSYMDYLSSPEAVQPEQKLLADSDCRHGEIRFEHVSFKYPGAQDYTLKDVSFCIRPGEKVALVGENGSGKTTLVKLLLRLYQPEKGKIFWNGQDIASIQYSDYMKAVTAVFQDFKILEDTVKNNLCFMEPLPEEKIWKVLEKTGMDGKIHSLPNGLGSYLGKTMYDNGQELSGGEKQKLAIARVLLKNAGMVIMDEPTAMLSPRVEYEIYTHFAELVKGRSAVYISHRMSSCRFCDWIMVLSNGVICEKGSHEELIALNGEYYKMYMAQAEFYRDMDAAEQQL